MATNVFAPLRSVNHALGVLLYQLLTGRTPLDLRGRPPHEIIGAILEGQPRPPSRVEYPGTRPPRFADGSANEPGGALLGFRRYLEEKLDGVVMTALAKDSGRRQRSARRLAEQIEARLK